MELFTTRHEVKNVQPEQVREYMATHHEAEYVLIDVREPEEFEKAHIAGAKLMPLSDLDLHIADIAKFEHKNLIFYCRTGVRSARASEYACKIIGFPNVFNLAGGFSAWTGSAVTRLPRLRTLDVSGGVERIVWQALELEKGAHRLYALLVPHFAGTEAAPVIEELARAEVAHSRTLYELLCEIGHAPDLRFEEVFESLTGELVESGENLADVVARAKGAGADGSLSLLELALEIELSAHDLYKNLADQAPHPESQKLLEDLAQREKRHADALLRKLERLASR